MSLFLKLDAVQIKLQHDLHDCIKRTVNDIPYYTWAFQSTTRHLKICLIFFLYYFSQPEFQKWVAT